MQIRSLQIGRGLAAMAVLAYHLSTMVAEPRFQMTPIFVDYTSHGFLGVDFFFVLSGFIMPFAHHGDIGKPDRAGQFALKRFIRLYPLYWMLTIVVLAGTQLTGGVKTIPDQPGDIVSTLTLVHFTSYLPPLNVAWTLFHEVLFYSLFMSVILNFRLGIALLGTWLTLIMSNWTYIEYGDFSFWNTLISAHNLSFFLGIAAYWISAKELPSSSGPICLAAGVAALAVIYLIDPGAAEGTLIRLCYSIAFMLLICGAVLWEKNRPINGLATLGLIGDASYFLYLAHSPIASTLLKIGKKFGLLGIVPPYALYVIVFAATVACAVIGYKLVEAPMLQFLRKRTAASRKLAKA